MAISERTRKTLWSRAHNQCAFPGCLQSLTLDVANASSGGTDVVVVGQEAHIRAQSVGGPRFDPGYPRDSIDSYENLVLMCGTHHTLIDANNGAGHTVQDLIKIKSDHERQQERRDALQVTLRAYLGDRYTAENTVQFQQADLRGPSVDSMFVDVPVGCRRDSGPLAELLTQIAESAPGDTAELESASGFVITGATQALLHPDWVGNAVLVGGPGQGKSTVLQYVCQFHRARRLGENTYTAEQSDLVRATSTARFPIRIDLRKYAQWATAGPSEQTHNKKRSGRKFRNENDWRSLEEYMVDDIRRHIGTHTFEARDFAVLIATEPVLLALDGLDEVASLPVRARVAEEIAGVRGRLFSDAANLVILVATRPGGSLQPLTATSAFPVLHLQRLTQGLRLQYLRQWVEVSQLTKEAADRLQSTFMDSQHVPHISELASYPMQLAILLHLLYRRQLLPQQRTELYAEYLKTFLDREQTEDKEPLLAEQRRVVEDTHAYLGWYLQTKAEQGQSSGAITREELRQLLRNHLAGHTEELRLADELYSAITDRVLCLVERDDAFEFEVQSLREYFAALYIFDNLTAKGVGNSRDDGLSALLERPYWANVCRFYVGMLTKGEVRALKDNFRVIEKRVSPHPMIRAMAVLVLNDRIYDGLADSSIRDVVDTVLDGPGVVLAEDGVFDAAGTPLRLGDRAGRSQAVAHLKERLKGGESSGIRQAAAASLAAHAVASDDVAGWWWGRFEPTSDWLRVASTLRVLGSLDPGRTARLRQALSATGLESDWHTALLSHGGYDGSDEEVLTAVHVDLNDGAVEDMEIQVSDSDLGIMIEGAVTASSLSRRTGAAINRATQKQSRPIVQAVWSSALTVSASPFDISSPTEWRTRLLAVAEAWGNGWVLRRAVSAVPVNLDLSAMSAAARSLSPVLATAASTEADIRNNRGDSMWWSKYLESATTALDRMLGVIALLEQARTNVIVELAATVDTLVGQLNPKCYRAVEHALREGVTSHRTRSLDLQDALRLRQVALSGRTLWLVRIVGTELTRERVETQLQTKLDDLLLAGTDEGREAVVAAHATRKLKLDVFRGSRPSLPPGGWANESRLAAMTIAFARDVLEEPDNWPADLVQMATDQLATRVANQTKPLADLAVTSGWFQSEA